MKNSNRILRSIISTLDGNYPVKEVRCGIHWTAVNSKNCGLASSMSWETCRREQSVKDIGSLTKKNADAMAEYSFPGNPTEASIGVAAINSLIEVDVSRCVELNASQYLLEKGKGENISIVGYFPFVDELKSATANLWIIEKRKEFGAEPEESAEKFLPMSDIVAISGTTLINHTLERLLSLCRKKSIKILLGGSTPLSPVFFDYGVDIIAGCKIIGGEHAYLYLYL
ncbi:MAG: DUF364 domain-containing protein [Elusimicrobiota bacterium]